MYVSRLRDSDASGVLLHRPAFTELQYAVGQSQPDAEIELGLRRILLVLRGAAVHWAMRIQGATAISNGVIRA